MQALVRVQARVRARRVRMSMEGQIVQKMLDERRSMADLLKQAEEGWCDSQGTLEEITAKLQMRQEGAFKRERALAYSLAQKQWKSIQSSDSQTNIPMSYLKRDRRRRHVEGDLGETRLVFGFDGFEEGSGGFDLLDCGSGKE
ncbi:uncharacterized protein LOC114323278 [Camellia sinensis]|uniref:uncharacterized protein LOC114323278 n=1 Tax=Camellia sinensis TaxID=4442 RepID=UPI00103583AD|nr:uncharacterized protein LOC114323278 [Camellia sinensis]